MYKLSIVLSGILRHKRRNVISFLLLVAVLSVTFCSFFYIDFAETQKEAVTMRYGNRYRISFRDELQYSPEHPKWSALDIRVNGTSTTNGIPDIFFDPEAMAMYNHPYPATKAMFDAIGALEECKEYTLAYAETAYGFSEDVPEDIQQSLNALYGLQDDHDVPTKITTEHIVVGGDLTALTGVGRETSVRNVYNFFLEEGTEPGKGECVITDFETAYTLYGTEETDPSFETRHHINNFFAYYDLYDNDLQSSNDMYTSFTEKVHQLLPESYREEFTVYRFQNSLDAFLQNPEYLRSTAMNMARNSILLTALIFCIVTIVLIHANSREIGLYLSLGISEKDIYWKTAGENALLMTISLAVSALTSRFVHLYMANGYTYIEMYELSYRATGMGAIFALCAVAVSFLVTILFTALYIRVHSPIQLIRQDES